MTRRRGHYGRGSQDAGWAAGCIFLALLIVAAVAIVGGVVLLIIGAAT